MAQRDPVVGYPIGRVAPGATWPYRHQGNEELLVARW